MYCQKGKCTKCGKNGMTYAVGYNGMLCGGCLEKHKQEKKLLWAIITDGGNNASSDKREN